MRWATGQEPFGEAGRVWKEPFGERNRLARQEPYGRIAGTLEPFGEAGTVRPRDSCCPASRRLLSRRHAVAGAPPAGVRPAAARPLSGCCGRSPAATAHGRTTPIQNLRKTLAFAAICISMFLHSFCSAEKRLTTRTRTCRGRAPETSPDHRTRVPTNLRQKSYAVRQTSMRALPIKPYISRPAPKICARAVNACRVDSIHTAILRGAYGRARNANSRSVPA
jgi:hypothetical protein